MEVVPHGRVVGTQGSDTTSAPPRGPDAVGGMLL